MTSSLHKSNEVDPGKQNVVVVLGYTSVQVLIHCKPDFLAKDYSYLRKVLHNRLYSYNFQATVRFFGIQTA